MTRNGRIRGTFAVTVVAAGLLVASANASSATPSASTLPRCSADDLSAKVTGTGEGMSQPSAFITVTNTGAKSCTVRGYPTITAARTKNGRQAITVTKGAVNNAPDTKVTRIVLGPRGRAWFAIGTATADDPPAVTFIRIVFTTKAGGGRAAVRVSLPATAPTGKPFPIGITAFAPGVGTSEG